MGSVLSRFFYFMWPQSITYLTEPVTSDDSMVLSKDENLVCGKNIIQMKSNTITNQTIIIGENISDCTKSAPIIFHAPNPISSFHGRDTELDELNEIFSDRKIAAICGMAGIGKSELANQFAYDNCAKFDQNLIWISSETEETLHNSFQSLAHKLKLRAKDIHTIVEEVYSYFNQKKALFIFDNAKHRQSIQCYLPRKIIHKGLQTFILITTQYSNWGDEIPIIKLNSLSVCNALKVFKSILKNNYNETDKDHFINLSKFLNCIPLGVQIAASYVNEKIRNAKEICSEFEVETYLSKLKEEEKELIDLPFPVSSENEYSKTIYASIKMSIETIQSQIEEAVDLLYYFSYLNSDHLPVEGLEIFRFETDIDSILTLLSYYSLIKIEVFYKKHRKIKCHRLVQWILRVHQKRIQINNMYFVNILILFEALRNMHGSYILKHAKDQIEACLFYYLHFESKDFLKYLVQYGYFIHIQKIFSLEKEIEPTEKEILLVEAVTKGHFDIVEFLLSQNVSPNCRGYSDNTILHIAISSNKIEIAKLLLKNNALIELRNEFTYTVLHVAAFHIRYQIIPLLIQLGSEVNVVDRYNRTPLYLAMSRKFRAQPWVLQCAKFLVDQGKAEVNIQDIRGKTALHCAANACMSDVVQFLVDRGADVNLVDVENSTALFYIPYNYFVDESQNIITAKMLIDNGAKVHVENFEGQSPVMIAKSKKLLKFAAFLESYDSKS